LDNREERIKRNSPTAWNTNNWLCSQCCHCTRERSSKASHCNEKLAAIILGIMDYLFNELRRAMRACNSQLITDIEVFENFSTFFGNWHVR
jgi:hypothetical protein